MPVALDLSCWIAAAPRPRPHDRRPLHQCGSDRDHSAGCGSPGEPAHGPTTSPAWSRCCWNSTSSAGRICCPQRGPGGRGAEFVCCAGGLRCGRTAGSCRRLPRSHHHRATVPASGERRVGAAVGIMDQYTAVHARAGAALMLDCRALQHRRIPLPTELRIVACNSMVRHSIAAGEYNKRRAECAAAVAKLREDDPGVTNLRDVDLPHVEAARAGPRRRALPPGAARRDRECPRPGGCGLAGGRQSSAPWTAHGRVPSKPSRRLRSERSGVGHTRGGSHRQPWRLRIADDRRRLRRLHGQSGARGCSRRISQPYRRRYEAATRLKPDVYVSASADAAGGVRSCFLRF